MSGNVILMALMNAAPGQDEAFNRWYEERHLADVLSIDGMIRATRYRVAGAVHAEGSAPWAYLTIYEVEAAAAASAAQELGRRRGTPALEMSDAMDEARLGWFFEKISERTAAA